MTSGTALQRFTTGVSAFGSWSTIAIGLSVPISIVFDNLFLAAALLAWLVGAQYRAKLALAWENPVYRAALLLFAVLLSVTPEGTAMVAVLTMVPGTVAVLDTTAVTV